MIAAQPRRTSPFLGVAPGVRILPIRQTTQAQPQPHGSSILARAIEDAIHAHAQSPTSRSPEQVQFYCLDFGGGSLSALAELPHVGSVAGRLETEKLRRTVAEISALLTAREQLFTRLRIDSMAAYRPSRRR